ncbi:chitinase, putative [Perkinsus marinus ATCC 50983]|uniref:Chitinase, putative n=1 Tax=Perkinsus marinus (strain ATCC 50983 / TXsc) TaxID=423536 RepID=C5LQJ9_PERM5|nr:chitinase, putative [Perkinsus marinus ATCC 50983]EER01045.1 chitinase, putative [Perkinsus marinus ATCC 50983]|eukprot:XP_002768327.1 chitinase, putative [Perkinsus marinus ATCC 50983]
MLCSLYLIVAAVLFPTQRAFEFYAYYTDKNDLAGKDQAYFDALFNCGVTELIFGGISASSTGELHKTFPDDAHLRMARKAADKHGARISFMLQGIPFIDAGKLPLVTFLKSANGMFKKHSFDGINFDWEFPRNNDEWIAYRNLMIETKLSVAREGRNASVTVAIGGSFDFYKKIDLCSRIDMCLWMGYDNYGDPRGHSDILWVEAMVLQWLYYESMSPSKFGLGVPLYGENRHGRQIRYSQLVAEGADPKGNGTFNGYFFDSQPILQDKIVFANLNKLGGLMAWVLQSDLPPNDTRSLLYGIKQKLNP